MLSAEEVRRQFAEICDHLDPLSGQKSLLDFSTRLIQQYADLEADMDSRLEDVTMLHNISRSLMSILDVDDLLRNIVDSVKERLCVASCSLLLLDQNKAQLQIHAASGNRFDNKMLRETRIPVGEGISGTVAQTGEPILVRDIESDPTWGRSNRAGYSSRSLLCVPMKVQDEVIGVLNVNEKKNGTPFDEYDLKILSILAANASAALASARFVNQIRGKESLISNIAQSVPSGILALGLDGQVLLVNRLLRRFMKIEDSTPTGKSYRSVLDPGVLGMLEPIITRAWETG
ncbi:MAG TPA: GAF domain-containing protein, partial [bacterium]|nr:GAF domain-containing protein [bacterium]